MAESLQLIKEESNNQSLRGGVRRGAGRKHGSVSASKWWNARGINPLLAGEILATIYDERKAWKRIAESADDRVVLQGLMFLVSMRDGKPSQQINLTSTNVHISADSIAKARAIVAEIRGTSAPMLGERSESLMLSGNEGGENGGSEDRNG